MVVKVESLLPLPDELSYDQGAGKIKLHIKRYASEPLAISSGLYVTWPTSYEALVGRAQLKPGTCSCCFKRHKIHVVVGEWVLVTAAAGGVGIAAVQLAKGGLPH